MKRFVISSGVIAILLVLSAGLVFAAPSKYVTEKAQLSKGNEGSAPFVPYTDISGAYSGLDEHIGDTLSVGDTWRDMQHNGVIGRMIGYVSEGTAGTTYEGPVVHVTWCYREGPEISGEQKYTKVIFETDNMPEVTRYNMDGSTVNQYSGAGFGCLNMLPGTNFPIIAYHGFDAGQNYQSFLSKEASFMEYFFNPQFAIPNFNANLVTIWPHFSTGEYNGTPYAHIITNPQEGDNEDELYYHRVSFNGTLFENATPGGANAIQVTAYAMNLSGVTATSDDGSHVAIGQTVSRWLQRGNIPTGWDGLALSQSDNDVYIWESTDGGETWDWNTPINVTDFTQANPDYLPGDTTSASQDTMRAYSEVDVIYDDENNLHVAFNAHGFDYYRETVSYTARIYYWNSVDQQFVQIADGDFWKGARPVAWERTVCHANIEYDEDTGVLWAMWQQYGEPSDTLIRNDTLYYTDITDDYYASAEIFVSASLDGGRRWMKGVNVTNTKFDGWDAQPGETFSEREPSFVFADGQLHIFYTIDKDGGIAVATNDPVGDPTHNPQVYQRIYAAEIMDIMLANAEYQVNYPVHFDADDGSWYQDPNDWAWDSPANPYSQGVGYGSELTPDQFELKQNYPNPFNPSTQIAFDLKKQGMVKLAVYDVLGREVVTLLNRSMEAGSHKVSFLADELPSGVYFYILSSGNASQVRKMVLMK